MDIPVFQNEHDDMWLLKLPEEWSCVKKRHRTVFFKLKAFSDASVQDNHSVRYSKQLDSDFNASVHPNGHNTATKGTVSVVFCRSRYFLEFNSDESYWEKIGPTLMHQCELNCTITIVDSEGRQRFPKSFVLTRDLSRLESDDRPSSRGWELANFVYLSRESILADDALLSPEDVLTLRLHVILTAWNLGERWLLYLGEDRLYKYNVWDYFIKDELDVFLKLDSYLGRWLRTESRFFEHLRVRTQEPRSALFRIPPEEGDAFCRIGLFFFEHATRFAHFFRSLDEIFHLYTVADKYDVRRALDACRSWLGLLCLFEADDIPAILEFAKRHEFLRKTLRGLDREDPDISWACTQNGDWVYERDRDKAYSFYVKTLCREEERKDFDFYS